MLPFEEEKAIVKNSIESYLINGWIVKEKYTFKY